jgi:hypothetical protein
MFDTYQEKCNNKAVNGNTMVELWTDLLTIAENICANIYDDIELKYPWGDLVCKQNRLPNGFIKY